MRHIADSFVIGGLVKCTLTPIGAILSGDLWGGGAFVAGAIVVATTLFGEFYFREQEE